VKQFYYNKAEKVCPFCRGKIKDLIKIGTQDIDKLVRHEKVMVDMITDEGKKKKQLFLGFQLPDIHQELTEDKHIGLEELLLKLRDTIRTTPHLD
jgi:hypothetical protein